MTRLLIGIDLDNTIVDYGASLHALASERGLIQPAVARTKAAVRRALKGLDEAHWRQLQAEVYGTFIARADPFDGVVDAIAAIRTLGHDVVVLSHKTTHSNFDPSVELRNAALGFLESRAIIGERHIPRASIMFFDSLDEKVAAARRLEIDWLVDDLRSVLEHPDLPERVVRLWFTADEANAVDAGSVVPCATWATVRSLVELNTKLGIVPTGPLARSLGPRPRVVAEPDRVSNARILRVASDGDTRSVAVKAYRRDGRRRAAREGAALRWMAAHGERCIPRLRYCDETAEVGVVDWIDGTSGLSASDSAPAIVDASVDFVLRLAAARREASAHELGLAADARLRLLEYRTAVERRFAAIEAASAERPPVLSDIAALLPRIVGRFEQRLAAAGLDRERELSPPERIPSPSDFGLHNVVVGPDGAVNFLDFEYFGWDDPTKLMADYLESVAHGLPVALRERFVSRLAAGLADGAGALERLAVVREIVSFEWILIVLNVLLRADASEPLVAARLARAEGMLGALAARLNVEETACATS